MIYILSKDHCESITCHGEMICFDRIRQLTGHGKRVSKFDHSDELDQIYLDSLDIHDRLGLMVLIVEDEVIGPLCLKVFQGDAWQR